ncbi:MAG: DnaD domain protein [Peptococcaceae bacterium MAG4]|nr:DnaD domain protein [Peptococcaceae bacterium MAG4]
MKSQKRRGLTGKRVQKMYPMEAYRVYHRVQRRVQKLYSRLYPSGVLVRNLSPTAARLPSAPKNIENIKNKDLYRDQAAASYTSEFEREFGRPLSPIEINKLASWQKSFPDELIKEALARAALQDKRSIAYVGGILKSWWAAGITTVEDARREQVRPGAKGGKRNANIRAKPGYRPSEVDWSAEPDTLFEGRCGMQTTAAWWRSLATRNTALTGGGTAP